MKQFCVSLFVLNHVLIIFCLGSVLLSCDLLENQDPGQVSRVERHPAKISKIQLGNHDFFPGEYSDKGVIGNKLPGTWRPFSDDSLWNTPIPAEALTHPDSQKIIAFTCEHARNIRLARKYVSPVWVVNSDNLPLVKVRSDRIFATWDKNRDGWTDIGVPITETMWAEPTADGHLCIIDPLKKISWELSRYRPASDHDFPRCTTFNIWDLTKKGLGDPFYRGWRRQTRGGRGSGFPIIAGLLRPEELESGEVHHALVFTFPYNRVLESGAEIFLPPACRSDGGSAGGHFPVEGMLFQLAPGLGEKDFESWGLSREGRIVARTLQKYGMFLCDNGGAMALQVQLLAPSAREHRSRWEELLPGFYKNVEKIPVDKFRVVYTGEPIITGE
jgi:hypothetical protein